jgi:hypothetical protein
MSHVKKKQSSPHTHLGPTVFEYTLGIVNRVELNRFDQSRKGGLLQHGRAFGIAEP